MEYHQLQKLLSVEFHRDQYLARSRRIQWAPGKVMINSVKIYGQCNADQRIAGK